MTIDALKCQIVGAERGGGRGEGHMVDGYYMGG